MADMLPHRKKVNRLTVQILSLGRCREIVVFPNPSALEARFTAQVQPKWVEIWNSTCIFLRYESLTSPSSREIRVWVFWAVGNEKFGLVHVSSEDGA